ncbi:armadillo-type protein [Powellomyces hirtus]|nr:armadillo-type protein [Powellomyces hirtus]
MAPVVVVGDTDLDFATTNDLFSKIRSQTNSGLVNQKQAAIILAAVEETIQDQNEQLTPLAYFGALMTILEQQRSLPGDNTTASESLGIMVAVTYLLAIVFPRIPSSILKLKFHDIAKTLGATLELYQDDQPLVRSVLTCFEFLLAAQDNAKWSSDVTCKKLFQVLLIMSVDGRPKVRRRAHDAVKRLLSRPPPPTALHPATLTTIEFSLRSLDEYTESVNNTAASAKDRKELEQQVLHVLVFLKMILPVLAMQGGHERTRAKLRALCEMLLRLPVRSSGTGNTVLTQWIFSVLESLFGAGVEKEGIFPHLDMALLDSVIRALIEIRPYQNDATLVPAWLDLIGRGFKKLAELATAAAKPSADDKTLDESQYAVNDYPKLLVSVFTKTFVGIFSQQSTKPIITAKAAQVFAAMIRDCVTGTMIQEVQDQQDMMQDGAAETSQLMALIALINGALSDIKYRAAWGGILKVAEALFERVGRVLPTKMQGTLTHIMAFRDDRAYGDSFPYKQELEVALHAAVQGLGLEVFVSYVELNIENENPSVPRRPYLLATFAEAVNRPLPPAIGGVPSTYGPHTLRYLGKVLLPLAQRMLEKSGASWAANRQVEAKLYETLGAQIWSMVPAICSTVPVDVYEHFPIIGPHFGRILQALPNEAFKNLPSKPDFRPTVCDAILSLIEGYQEAAKVSTSISKDEEDAAVYAAQRQEDAARAVQGLGRLKEYSNRFLSVLCNNYTTVQPDFLETSKAKGQQLQVLHERENQHYAKTIRALLTIADEQNVTSYFLSLVTTLLESQSQQHAEPESTVAQLSKLRDYAILDLLLILLPFLPEVKTKAKTLAEDSPLLLFYKVLTGQLRDSDATLQKRTYKALNHVVGSIPASALNLEELVERLLDPEVLSKATSGAKKARIQLLQRVCQAIPTSEKALLLSFVPVALSEVMLATKEASEKARNAAYECVVAMGRKMLTGGVENPAADLWAMDDLQRALDENPEQAEEGQINLREFFMMVIAGLAGETATMQSASIAALSRLLFEFGPMMDEKLLKELISTITFVMNTKNREVIKAALGFVKVAIVSLRQELLEDELENIIVAILTQSRNHKSHFKAKVRHIFERLVRKFSYEAVEGFVPEEDKKLLVNIRKRREREKKRKALARQNRDGAADQDDSDGEASKATLAGKSGKAVQKQFEDALYGSESELDSDEDDADDDDEKYIPDQFKDGLQRNKRGAATGSKTMIREDGEVADFLDSRIVSRVTSAPRRTKTSVVANGRPDFTHSADGRLMINESGSEDEDPASAGPALPEADAMDVPEDHYKESLHSEVAFTRTADGRVRFLKPDAKRKRAEDDPEADANRGATATGLGWGQHNKHARRNDVGLDQGQIDKMLGKQFKAKRARGDVKKAGGPDPFAYIPLTSKVVGGKKRKAAKVAGQFKNIIKATQSGGHVGAAGAGSSAKGGPPTRKGNKKHK